MTDPILCEAFLRTLYAPALGHPDLTEAHVSLWARPSSRSIHCPLSDLETVALEAAVADEGGSDVYFGVALRRPGLSPGVRGTKRDLLAATSLWVDIDIKGPAHAADNLPASTAQALDLITELGLEPDQVIHSGNGLHVYWYLDAPAFLRTAEEVALFEEMNVTLQKKVRDIAARRGLHLDMTANADRVLRLPGMHNRKVADVSEPVAVPVEAPVSAPGDAA